MEERTEENIENNNIEEPEEERKWTVYIHTVPKELSGYEYDKYYVGITSLRPENRWRNGKGYDKQPYFYKAIKKYGWSNIRHEIIETNLTKTEACEIEKLLINKLSSTNKKYGYNLSLGGQFGRFGLKLSDEAKEKISKAHKNKIVSEETKLKISQNHPDFNYGNNPNAENTYQFDKNGIFIAVYDSVSFASFSTKIDRHSISVAAANNRMAGGYLWAHDDNVLYKNNTYILKSNNYIDKRNVLFNKEVYQFLPNGEFISKYISCVEASKNTGISRATISDNAKNKSNSKKFLWRYKEDVKESEENPGSFFIA